MLKDLLGERIVAFLLPVMPKKVDGQAQIMDRNVTGLEKSATLQ